MLYWKFEHENALVICLKVIMIMFCRNFKSFIIEKSQFPETLFPSEMQGSISTTSLLCLYAPMSVIKNS